MDKNRAWNLLEEISFVRVAGTKEELKAAKIEHRDKYPGYFRGSFREIRQVRWPNRKATWKMVLAVLVYTALFVVIITLLDLFFTWLFSLILG